MHRQLIFVHATLGTLYVLLVMETLESEGASTTAL
jgi:hypothetical protein